MKESAAVREEAKDLVVLYVEDEAETRSQVTQILQLFFKEVKTAENGKIALDIYKENEIDLIMTDLTMPVMCGIDMIKEVKKIALHQHVVILTAHNSSEDLMETIDLQVDGFLLKPIKMDKLLELLLKVTHTINLEKKEN